MKLIGTKQRRHVLLVLVLLFLVSAAIAQDAAKQLDTMPQPRAAGFLAAGYGDAALEAATSTAIADPAPGVAPPFPSGTNSLLTLWKAYNAAVEHTGVWRNEDVRLLKPLTMAADGTVEVLTATKYDVTSPLYGDTWVTIVPELRSICRQFTGDVAMQVRELLGLPPDHQIPNMVVMKVQASDMFRPTPDPTPWTLCPCGNPTNGACKFDEAVQCGNSFPKDAPASHVQWIANTTLSVRQLPGGFPWTHLGYTYNWKPGDDPYGASEYIVRKGAKVVVVSKMSLEDYCKP